MASTSPLNNILITTSSGRMTTASFTDLRCQHALLNFCVSMLQSYYGGLLCCTWSPDGRFIATGGEDDLISLYSCEARCVVAWGAGHHSWVSAVAFDTW